MYLVRRIVIAVFACLTLLPCCSSAQQTTVTELSTYLDQAHQAGLFNGNVLVADHGKVILRRALGDADGSQLVPLTLADRFYIGSIAKEFDAVGLLILAQDGKLALTDPLSKFFPDLPPWAATVTIDNLLHYTSGLQEPDWNIVHSDADNWKELHALQHLNSVPGTHYAYSNNNVFLRRRVIEKVSGMSFEEFLVKREFPKAGIRNAVIDPADAEPLIAKSFDANHKQDAPIAPISGWVCLSLDDFLRWSDCIRDFCLITPSSTRQIVTTQNPAWQTGLGQAEMKGDQLLSHVHDGSVFHYRALLMMDAPKGRTIILLSNQNQNNIYDIGNAIDAMLDHKAYSPLSASKND